MADKKKQLDAVDLKLLRVISPPCFDHEPLSVIVNKTEVPKSQALMRLKRMEKLGYVKMKTTSGIISFRTTEYGSIAGQLSATYEHLSKIDTELGRYAAGDIKETLDATLDYVANGGLKGLPINAIIIERVSNKFP